MTEDLTTYTAVGAMNITAPKVSGSFYGGIDRYLYKDFGVGYFDGINLNFEGLIANSDPYGYRGKMLGGFSNVVNDVYDWASGDNAHIAFGFGRYGEYGVGTYSIQLLNYDLSHSYDGSTINPDTVYYLTLTRSPGSDTVYLKIYTDAARTSLYDTLSVSSLGTEKWRYFYAASSYHDGIESNTAQGYYQNYEFLSRAAGQVRFIGMRM